MTALQGIPDEELADLARHWRAEALRGSKDARGTAHLYEAELRRRGRNNSDEATQVVLDMRPLSAREESRRWWRLW
ncbi:hypothetical protein [Corticimicrobacter populi]|uniref:Uncharacterized protein n=1 Tax=Corticimicrobacter populi TaxID=2175229 RepID=A0A2V1K1T6_9BURK|nr:hypothetical protein [Corticimicrobacter populi]PWF24076.1 hypothetical protein DD235_07125 [Corticimicrobacter populi]